MGVGDHGDDFAYVTHTRVPVIFVDVDVSRLPSRQSIDFHYSVIIEHTLQMCAEEIINRHGIAASFAAQSDLCDIR